MYACMYVCMYVNYVCMYVCMYVNYVCMLVSISIFCRNTIMLELVQLALTDIADNYKTLIDNQLRAYQRG